MWCSHMLKNSMSFTTTISSYFTSYNAPFRIFWISIRYPLVRNFRALSTRSGVRNRPSRRGSSPNAARISSMCGAMFFSATFACITFTTALFDFIGSDLKGVLRRLADADPLQLRPRAGKHRSPVLFQPPADLPRQVLRRRDLPRKALDFRIQVPVVERRQHLPPHQFVQNRKVHRPPVRVQRSPGADLDDVVMTVPVRVIALPVERPILFL